MYIDKNIFSWYFYYIDLAVFRVKDIFALYLVFCLIDHLF